MSLYGKFIGTFAGETEEEKMIKTVQSAKEEWIVAEKMFNEAVEEEMVDYAIYDMMAAKTRYAFLVKKAKEMGLR